MCPFVRSGGVGWSKQVGCRVFDGVGLAGWLIVIPFYTAFRDQHTKYDFNNLSPDLGLGFHSYLFDSVVIVHFR